MNKFKVVTSESVVNAYHIRAASPEEAASIIMQAVIRSDRESLDVLNKSFAGSKHISEVVRRVVETDEVFYDEPPYTDYEEQI